MSSVSRRFNVAAFRVVPHLCGTPDKERFSVLSLEVACCHAKGR